MALFPVSLCSLGLRVGIQLLWAPGEDDWSPPHPDGALAALLRAQAGGVRRRYLHLPRQRCRDNGLVCG